MKTTFTNILTAITAKSSQAFEDLLNKLNPIEQAQAKQLFPPPESQSITIPTPKTTKAQPQPLSLIQRKKQLLTQLQQIDYQLTQTRSARTLSTPHDSRSSSHNNNNNPSNPYNNKYNPYKNNNSNSTDQQVLRKADRILGRVSLKSQGKYSSVKGVDGISNSGSLRNLRNVRDIEEREMKLWKIQEFLRRQRQKGKVIEINYKSNTPDSGKNAQNAHMKNPQKSQRKIYEKSPFLEQVLKDQYNSKKQQLIKAYEKRNLKERQKLFAMKVREKQQ